MSDTRIVFMGTPDFAVGTLDALNKAGMKIVGVVTAPDKPAGRGKKLRSSAVKDYTLEHLDCPLFQPEKLKVPEVAKQLKELDAHLFIVVAFRMLPELIWSIPPKGTINLHASLLPHYRGAAPINWCIINGESESGVSTFLIDYKIDTGKILLQEKVAILPDESAGSLHDKLMLTGSNLMVKTVINVMEDMLEAVDQNKIQLDTTQLQQAPKIFKEDCKIDWTKQGLKIHNLIRGLSPFPSAYTILAIEGKEDIPVKIFEGVFIYSDHIQEVGTLISENKNELKVAVNSGFYTIKSLQMAGKKRMNVGDFLRGFQVDISTCKFLS